MSESKFRSGIYKITINDYYIYIGQSMDIERRWNSHLSKLKQNRHCNRKLQSVFNKHSDSIKFEIIEECNTDELDNKEIYWIGYYRSYDTKHGLNMSIGGDSGHRKYKTREEAEVTRKEKHKEYYKVHKKEISEYYKQYYNNNIEKLKEYSKQWHVNNKDKIKQYYKKYHQDNKECIRQQYRQWCRDNEDYFNQYAKHYRRQKGILSKKERFEKRYNLSRPLTNREWDIWRNTKNHQQPYAIKFLKSLPNLTFTVPSKK